MTALLPAARCPCRSLLSPSLLTARNGSKHGSNLNGNLQPDVQANAYSAVVADARRRSDRGKMLEALQAMRAVSLAPLERGMVASDQDYINSSARLMATIAILDEIRERGEKALLFVEMRAAQADLDGVLQRRYGLARAPMIISGEVAGPKRQERVDAFQAAEPGFDVMILSPKAGGHPQKP